MSEPQGTIAFALFNVLGYAAAKVFGPVLGPFALLLFAASVGALLGMSREGEMTRPQGAVFMAVSIGVSLVLTGLCVWLIEKYTAVPGHIALMPVAFGVAAGRAFILGLIETMFKGIGTAFVSMVNRGGSDK